MLGSWCREGLAFFDNINGCQPQGLRAGIARVMLGAVRDDEPVAGFDLESGLALDQNLALAFHHVADFFAGMCMPPRCRAGRDLNAYDHGLASGHGYIVALHYGALDSRILRPKHGSNDGKK